MPRYDYACHECGHRFETVHPITSDPLSVCPECSGTLRRVIGAVGVSFKGSGFYQTDSRAAAKKRGRSSGSASPTTPTAPAVAATTSAAPTTPAAPTTSPTTSNSGS